MNFRTYLVIFALLMISVAQLFGKGSLIKQHTITLPYIPAGFKFNAEDIDITVMRIFQTTPGFYFFSGLDGQKKDSLLQCLINNNPKNFNVMPFVPMLVEFATINKGEEQKSPLFDTALEHVSMHLKFPAIVTHKEPNKIYLVESTISSTQTLQGSEIVCDAQEKPSGGFSAFTLGTTGTVEGYSNEYIFAAVKDSEGVWGSKDSGIAVVPYVRKKNEIITTDEQGKEKKEVKVERYFATLDATTGKLGDNKAVSLEKAYIAINGGDYSINSNAVELFWNPFFERLYVALQVKNSEDCLETQGSRALLVARVDTQQRLVFDPILSDDLCQGVDKIIGATGPGVATSLHKIRTLVTSSGYTYLIIVGGVGEPQDTDRDVYALPITYKSLEDNRIYTRAEIMDDSEHGIIASKNSDAINMTVLTGRGYRLNGRHLPKRSFTPDDTYTKYDKEVVVGAGKKLPSTITDVVILSDCVYVTCAKEGEGQHPGIFHSQALLQADGKIAAWTPWQRIAGIQEGIDKALVTADNYCVVYLRSGKPELECKFTADTKIMKINQTQEEMQTDLPTLLNKLFVKEKGGIYGLVDVPSSTPICGHAMDISFLIATGYKKVVLTETGSRTKEGIFTAFKESYTENVFEMHDGALQPIKIIDEHNPYSVVIEGGVLDNLGAITEAVIAHDDEQSWIIVANNEGIAILSAQDGSGIKNDFGLLPHFAGITKTFTFKKFGAYTGIRKIWADNQFLYVLTSKSLERIELGKDDIAHDNLKKRALLAKLTPEEGSFFDIGVSGPLCILASSKGVFVNAPGTDCREAKKILEWHKIELPHAKGIVYRLFFVSSKDQKNGFGHGGQIYVSTGSLAENITRLYRLYVDDVFTKGVTEKSVQLVTDIFYLKYGIGPLLLFENFRDQFATDGAHYFSARSRQTRENPFIKLVSLPIIKETRPVEPIAHDIPMHLGKKCSRVSAIVQNSASGNWLFAGDFGLALHN